jgi:hypothetical protein
MVVKLMGIAVRFDCGHAFEKNPVLALQQHYNKPNTMRKANIVVGALLLLLWGCNSSKITSSWKAGEVVATKYNKILVLALIPEKDRLMQERMEQHFVGDLTNLGYTAVSAMQQYGPKAFENLDEKAVLSKIKSSGADAVITIVLLNKEKERTYVPGRTYTLNTFGDYYLMHQQRIYEPGYYATNTQYLWESNFYDLANQTLLYSAQTKSFSPSSTEALSHHYGVLLVSNMRKMKVLQDRVPLTPGN